MKKIFAILGCMVLLSGCTQSNIVNPSGSQAGPNFEIVEGVELDRVQMNEDLVEYMNSHDIYTIGKGVEVSVDEKDENITISLIVADGSSPEDAAGFAESMAKAYADAAAVQDFTYKTSTIDTYGTYFDTRNVRVFVAPESTKDDSATWLVDQTIAAGTNEHVKPLGK